MHATANNGLPEALHRRISYLRELHTLSQTQSLMLDEADYAGFVLLGESKEALINDLRDVDRNVDEIIRRKDTFEQIPEADMENYRTLSREAARLTAIIVSLDTVNRSRLEQVKVDLFNSLKATQTERHLRKTYNA